MSQSSTIRNHTTAKLGDLVVAAFDVAAETSSDPVEASRLATAAVEAVLRRAAFRARAQMRRIETRLHLDRVLALQRHRLAS